MQFRPWWVTMTAKLAVSRLPVGYRTWARFGVFRHGGMDDGSYAISVFNAHVRAAGLVQLQGARILEMGPGDGVATALIAASHRASAVLVDVGDFVAHDLAPYKKLNRQLSSHVDLEGCTDLADLMSRCHGSQYLTHGLASLKTIPTASIDFLFSNAVLEHVDKDEFADHVVELKRILKPGALMSHEIDFRDHLGGGKNNMRFSSATWNSRLFRSAGFYTNRIACSDMVGMFLREGMRIVQQEASPHVVAPPPRRALAPEFRAISEADLNTAILKIVLST
ncbi:class I SAM-dependent methyltransferase [Aquabacterium soli]|uniref:Class I SAM-dependent methyltransferase n=1 Tax=Aquabacterium soli TaxID=2493092 RepID=A0A426VBU8_9BURK|nr:class I SAM-dependent methyltransferase [Aquabacterium soli]RRS04344.1 class I SAM-dependent methyltransferase [Aquabacterium soli]